MQSNELKQAVIAFSLATILVAILGLIAQGVAFVHANLGALVALVFLGMTLHFAKRNQKDLADYGYHTSAWPRSLWVAGSYVAIIFPVFVIGFYFFYEVACAKGSVLAPLAPIGNCLQFDGWSDAHWPDFGLTSSSARPLSLEFLFVQVIVVALPEELFFRGFIHELCEKALPPKRRVWRGGIGWALILSSLLFALGHLAVTFDARRLAVFFPGLVFGWMRSATGSILAGVIAHAASNVFILVLQEIFF